MVMILGHLGIHVLKREIIFIDIALAQIAAVGSIVAHLVFGVHGDSLTAYASAYGFVLLVSGFYALVRSRVVQIPLEAVIGVSYAIAAAGALFLVGTAPGGHVHIQEMLAGSLLWTTWTDIFTSLAVFSAVGLCFYVLRKPMNRISDNYRNSHVSRAKIIGWDFLFYALLGLVITLAVRLAITWIFGIVSSSGGLLFAYYLDFSVGPAIAMLLGMGLGIAALVRIFLDKILSPAK